VVFIFGNIITCFCVILTRLIINLKHMPYHENLKRLAKDSTDYRRVVHTGTYMQLVLMSIPPGGEIGEEVHNSVDQFFYFVEGRGEAVVDGKSQAIEKGDGVFVSAGLLHNIKNSDIDDPLQLFTLYAPPNHPEGRVDKNKGVA
jgi:mannose-6-phosphate isomerase-like protein (cupin superfamily)